MTPTEVETLPGSSEGVQGPDLMERMQAQAERFGVRVPWDAVELDLTGPVRTVVTADGERFETPAVMLTGSPHQQLGLPDEQRLSGRGVSWCATCDGFFLRDQDVVVVGGRDSAVEEATFLTRFARPVTLAALADADPAAPATIPAAIDTADLDLDAELAAAAGADTAVAAGVAR